MNEAQQALLMIKGAITELSQADQQLVTLAADEIKAVIVRYEEAGSIALALVGAECSAAA